MTRYQKMAGLGVIGLLAFILITPHALANYNGRGYGYHGYGMMKETKEGFENMLFWKAHFLLENAEALGLSEKQQDEVRNLKLEAKKSLIAKEAEIKIVGLDIKNALRSDTVDVDAVNKLVDQKYELKKEKTKSLVESYAELKKVLSADQIEKMKTLFKEKMAEWHQKG